MTRWMDAAENDLIMVGLTRKKTDDRIRWRRTMNNHCDKREQNKFRIQPSGCLVHILKRTYQTFLTAMSPADNCISLLCNLTFLKTV